LLGPSLAGTLTTDSARRTSNRGAYVRRMEKQPPKAPTFTALVIEDYRPERLLLKRRLQQLSFQVLEAADGRSAMRHLTDGGFDLICLDLMLPDLSGLQICESIRRSPRHGKVPILVLSARALPEDRAHAEQAGASAYLVKPFNWADFDVEVRRLVGAASHQTP
jgi:DNA-binding response OmpR family regulator